MSFPPCLLYVLFVCLKVIFVILTSQQGAHKLEEDKNKLRYSWRKKKGMFSLSLFLEGVTQSEYFYPIHTLQRAIEVYKRHTNDVSLNPSRQLITTSWEIWAFKSLMVRKRKNIFLRSYRESRMFQIWSKFPISRHNFIQYCKYKTVLHVSFPWYIYHSSRDTPAWEPAVILLRTITWNIIFNFIQSNVINNKQMETCKKCLLQNST